jgi:SNF2 family DNA or RNA helicase
MTETQRYWYNTAKDEILEDLLEDDFSSIAIFRLFSALQQITSGYWRRRIRKRNKEYEKIEMSHYRINTLVDTISEIPKNEKIIIWTKFQYDIFNIKNKLDEIYGEEATALFYGGINEQKRSEQVAKFKNKARFFLATQSSGGHGLTLNEASYVIFYNNGFKYSERLQAEDRCHRIGQKNKVTYIDICCLNSIDSIIEDALSRKSNAVYRFKQEIDKVKDHKTKVKELIKAI